CSVGCARFYVCMRGREAMGVRTAFAVAARATVLVCVAFGLSACLQGPPRNGVPQALAPKLGQVSGYPLAIRIWGDSQAAFPPERLALLRQQRVAASKIDPRIKPNELNALTLSGGGSSGAFGAGILTGWSETGTRPQFDVVTGISTGSLIAPFAFLG